MLKNFKVPNNIVIVFSIIILAAVLTWIVPGGKYDRQTIKVNGVERTVIVNDTYKQVDSQPQTWQIFSAFYKGFINMSHIVVFILMIGGAFWIMNETRAIDIGILSFLTLTKRFEKWKVIRFLGVDNIIMSFIMIIFSSFGAIFGMAEETLAFTLIFVQLSIRMGYDSLVGIGLCYFAAHVGFAGAILNPFTIGIAQGLSSIPLFSGIEYRVVCWLIFTFVAIAFVLWYAHRVKKNPKKSIIFTEDEYWRKRSESDTEKIEYYTPKSARIVAVVLFLIMLVYSYYYPSTNLKVGLNIVKGPFIPILTAIFGLTSYIALRKSLHFFILNILAFTIFYLILGVLGYDWYIMEIAALFLAMGVFTGFAAGKKNSEITRLFQEGVKDIVSAALVVGFAGGIIAILNDGQIIDTVLFSLSNSLKGAGQIAAITIMYGFQSLLNLVITSGSAKAALTIPIMAQFSDIIGLSRQATIMAFQFGSGITDMIAPTSGVLIGVLGIAKVPYGKWVKFIIPFVLGLAFIAWLLLIPTVTMKLNGF
ncbi:MAG: AbgT family transporter [Bacteroidales bacterium]|nr:AbgT family transporter [Bacteroidales bacterium]